MSAGACRHGLAPDQCYPCNHDGESMFDEATRHRLAMEDAETESIETLEAGAEILMDYAAAGAWVFEDGSVLVGCDGEDMMPTEEEGG